MWSSDLQHHGILGQKWGKKNGPPYPLSASDHSASEKKAGWRKSLEKYDEKESKLKARKAQNTETILATEKKRSDLAQKNALKTAKKRAKLNYVINKHSARASRAARRKFRPRITDIVLPHPIQDYSARKVIKAEAKLAKMDKKDSKLRYKIAKLEMENAKIDEKIARVQNKKLSIIDANITEIGKDTTIRVLSKTKNDTKCELEKDYKTAFKNMNEAYQKWYWNKDDSKSDELKRKWEDTEELLELTEMNLRDNQPNHYQKTEDFNRLMDEAMDEYRKESHKDYEKNYHS